MVSEPVPPTLLTRKAPKDETTNKPAEAQPDRSDQARAKLHIKQTPDRVLPASMVPIALITIVAVATRAWGLNSPLWYDEIATVVSTLHQPFGTVVTEFTSNNHHPLFSALAKISMILFGESAWSIRLPAVIFGVLAVPALYIFARPIAPRPVALAAALLLAVAYHSVWFSQNARGYTMLLFFAIAATHFLNNAVVLGANLKRNYALYAICLALAAYTHMTMVILGVVHAICVLGYTLLSRQTKPRFGRLWPAIVAFLGAAALTIMLYAPMLTDVITFFMTDALAEPAPKTNEVATPGWALLVAVEELTAAFGGPAIFLIGCTVLLVGGLSFLRHQPFLAATIALTIPAMVLSSAALGRPIFPRFFFFQAGFFLLTALQGLWIVLGYLLQRARVDRWIQPAYWAACVIAVLAGLPSLFESYRVPKQDFGAAAAAVAALPSGSQVFTVGTTMETPMNEYLGLGLPNLKDSDDFARAEHELKRFYVTYTFVQYLQSVFPDLWAEIEMSCKEHVRIPSTIKGGDIVLLSCGNKT